MPWGWLTRRRLISGTGDGHPKGALLLDLANSERFHGLFLSSPFSHSFFYAKPKNGLKN
jgi:hypothetical protein